jgi:hypothetical protein
MINACQRVSYSSGRQCRQSQGVPIRTKLLGLDRAHAQATLKPGEIADTVAFLARSPESQVTHGAIVPV